MRIFVTGASGFIGSAVVRELLGAGHHVLGMVRSDAGAAVVEATGAEVHRGDLIDLDSLRRGAASADVVIHTAFVHDAVNAGSGRATFQQACEIDARAIEVLGNALVGTSRHFLVTSGTPPIPGRIATEEDAAPRTFPRMSEPTALAFAERGVRVALVRMPRCVHAPGGPWGLGTVLVAISEKRRVSAYVGEGTHR